MRILLTFVSLVFSVSLFAKPLNKMVVFGDSLSDTGNLYEYMKHQIPISPPYYNGRFTNGPVWIDLLAEHYYPNHVEKHLENYAYGGAGVMDESLEDPDSDVFTFNRELNSYFLAHHDKASSKTLFIVWIGSNNYLAMPDDPDQTIETVTGGIMRGLQRLVDHGAQNILVVNLPDMGLTPAAHDMGNSKELSLLTKKHNKKLYDDVMTLQAKYPDIHWVYLDVDEMFADILAAPSEFGFTNTTETCYEAMMEEPSPQGVIRMVSNIVPKSKKDACEGFLFFDPVHPSAKAHGIMFHRSKNSIEEKGIEFQADDEQA